MASIVDTFDQEILRLVNEERAKVGVDPLEIDAQLDQAADLHTQDQANTNRMSHYGSDGSSPFARINETGYEYSAAGENVAFGYEDAQAVMDGWMNSSGHRRNILSSDFTEIGIGYDVGDNGSPYWTQVFGNPADVSM